MTKRAPVRRRFSTRELQFARIWQAVDTRNKQPFEREHRFDAGRMWRFDFAWPSAKVAVEIEGGTFSRGKTRHTSSTGHQSDCEKYNAAAIAGWCVLKYTAKDLDQRPVQVCREVISVIESRERSGQQRGWGS